MRLRENFNAWGHPNVMSSHRTTLMITKEAEITPKGDCIVAVRAEKGLEDLDQKLKEAMRNSDARILLAIEAGGTAFEVTGRGDPGLILSHPTDIVARKSRYICERTLMIQADKATCDVENTLVDLLKDHDRVVNVSITVEL